MPPTSERISLNMRKLPFACSHMSSDGPHFKLRTCPFWTAGGLAMQTIKNHKIVIKIGSNLALLEIFDPISHSRAALIVHTTARQHNSIRGTLGGLKQYPLEISCLFYFDLTHSCASWGFWIYNFSNTAEYTTCACTSHRLFGCTRLASSGLHLYRGPKFCGWMPCRNLHHHRTVFNFWVDFKNTRWWSLKEEKEEIMLGRFQMQYLLQWVNSFTFQHLIIKWPQETQHSVWSAVLAISLHSITVWFNFQRENLLRGKWKPL